jgi:hypothetical protein
MTSKLLSKRSAVPGKVPTTAQIDLGELAINTRDGKLYLKRDNGNGTFTIIDLGAVRTVAGRSGDVVLGASDVGLGNVNNTSDQVKPISEPQQTALTAKADVARQIATGAGLIGGGDLGANRTIAADIASQAEARAGSSNAKLITALRAQDHMNAKGFGWGYNYQGWPTGRDTVHQNTFGRPALFTWMTGSSTQVNVEVSSNASAWGYAGTSRYGVSASTIIFPGWYWRIRNRNADTAVLMY